MTDQTHLSRSPEETFAVGETVGRELKPDGDATARLLLLEGELGAGKTHFVKGVAAALGVAPEDVTSPTFALVQVHPFPGGTLWHVDLYRLPTGAPIADVIELDEMLEQPGVVAVEWPERLGAALDGILEQHPALRWVRIAVVDETTRRITIRSRPHTQPDDLPPRGGDAPA